MDRAGLFTRLEQLRLEAYDEIVGPVLGNTTENRCLLKKPAAARANKPRRIASTGHQILPLLFDGTEIPLGVVSPPNSPYGPRPNDSLDSTTAKAALPVRITGHQEAPSEA